MSNGRKQDSDNDENKLIEINNQKLELQEKIKKMEIQHNELTTLNNELKQKLNISYNEVTCQKDINETNNKFIEELQSKNESLLNRTIILTKTKLELIKNQDNKIQEINKQKIELEKKINELTAQKKNIINSTKFELEQQMENTNIQLIHQKEKNTQNDKQIKELNKQLIHQKEKNTQNDKQIKELNKQLINEIEQNYQNIKSPIFNREQLENKLNFLNYINKFDDNNLNKLKTLIKLVNKRYSDLTIAIKTPSPTTNRTWGDYFFSLSLKKSLEKKGFNVVIHELEHWAKDESEIVIVLRGLTDYNTQPQHLNFMWNISHPDDISLKEYEKYDIVFVASNKYANALNNQVNTLVHPLLQCTDPTNFFPEKNMEFDEEILFVGTTRKIFRKIVQDTIKTGHDFSVYGAGWEEFIDSKYIKGNFIDNNILNRAYSTCKILLNDHWADMITNDFVSNRLFDALACKAFVISDYVPSIQTIFEGNVITYSNPDDLNNKLNYYLTHESERTRLANKGYKLVLKNHTFDNRVDEILNIIEKKFYLKFIKQCEMNWNITANSEAHKINNTYNLFDMFLSNNYETLVNENKSMTIEIVRLQEKIHYLEQEKMFHKTENNNTKKTKNLIRLFKSHV